MGCVSRRPRSKLAFPEPIDDVLDRAGEDRFARTRPPIPDRAWRETVGARIAERSHPMTLERGVLTVRAATSVWANELQLLSDPIRERLCARGLRVRELRFLVGNIERPARPPERRLARAVPPHAALPDEVARALRAVGDPELRETIALAARANLAWQSELAKAESDEALSEAPRGARAPRSSGTGSDPPGHTTAAARAGARCTSEVDPGRRR